MAALAAAWAAPAGAQMVRAQDPESVVRALQKAGYVLFIDNIEFWASVLGKFEQHIGYRK